MAPLTLVYPYKVFHKHFFLFFILFLTACSTIEDPLVVEYETHIVQFSERWQEHEAFATSITQIDLPAEEHNQALREYTTWAEIHREEFISFKTFIEIYYKELRVAGKNPLLIRDLLKLLLEDIEKNEAFFERCNMIWDRYHEE